jgi:dTDP-glucose 4,6-dehydratase
MDNLIKKENIENITHLLGHERFKFIKYDVTEYLGVSSSRGNILHFASLASPKDYLDYPIQTLKVGSLGTHKALGLAKEKEKVTTFAFLFHLAQATVRKYVPKNTSLVR